MTTQSRALRPKGRFLSYMACCFLFAVLSIQKPSEAQNAKLLPVNPAGKREGLLVQCRVEGVFVRKSPKSSYVSFEQYLSDELEKLKKKLKGKSANEIREATNQLKAKLNALHVKLKKECSGLFKRCAAPNVRVIENKKQSTCEGNLDRCNLRTMRCTNAKPESCACDAKPETPTPTPTLTPTPPNPGGSGGGGGDGGSGNDQGESSVTISLEQFATVGRYRVFIIKATSSKPNTKIASFFSSINNKGVIAGGFYEHPALPYFFVEKSLTGLSPWEEEARPIVPFLFSQQSFLQGCRFGTCPKGLILKDVNDNGIAIGQSTKMREDIFPDHATSWKFNGPERRLTPVIAAGASSVCVEGINNLNLTVGMMNCYKQNEQSVLWDETGKLFDIVHDSILNPYEDALKAAIKEDVMTISRRDYVPAGECTEQDVLQTRITNFLRNEGATPHVRVHDINNRGDILGVIKDNVSVFLENACSSLWSSHVGSELFFTVSKEGSLRLIDLDAFIDNVTDEITPVAINDNRLVLVEGNWASFEVPPRLPFTSDTTLSPARWNLNPFKDWGPDLAQIRPRALNNKGEIIGDYFIEDRVFIQSPAGTVWLNELLPSSGPWQLMRASDINECGEVVGNVVGPHDDVLAGFLLSPVGCR